MIKHVSPIHLSVAAPLYNEGAGILTLVQQWHAFLTTNPDIASFEIIICNDGSTDDSKVILDSLANLYSEVRPIHFSMNQGAAAALNQAIAVTQFEWILLMDSDGQFPIENLTAMITAMRLSLAMAVLGVRNKKDQWYTRFGTYSSGFICNLIHRSRLRDFNSAFKLVSGPLLRSFMLEAKGMNYSTEITSRLLESLVPLMEVDIEHKQRILGKSHMKLVKDSMSRLLFVAYLALRQLLVKMDILRRSYENEKQL